MRHQPGWSAWESYVNEELGLSGTPGSGNQWHAKGDGYDPTDSEYALQVESKYTEGLSFGISRKKVNGYAKQAALAGKKFALTVRIWTRGAVEPADYAVIPFEMFVDLIKTAKEAESARQHP